ncbi:MAG: thioesterase family protein [Candidatus Aphodosoma sp.]
MKSISKIFVVGKQDTAAVMGSGLLDVLATPTMVAWMENTSILLTEEYLKDGDTTVGICINTSHEKASAVGEKITCTATLIKVDGRKLSFEIECFNENNIRIGKAYHERFIVNSQKFMSKL